MPIVSLIRVIKFFYDSKHPSKEKKYRVTLDQYTEKYRPNLLEDDFKTIEALAKQHQENGSIQKLYKTLWILRIGQGTMDIIML